MPTLSVNEPINGSADSIIQEMQVSQPPIYLTEPQFKALEVLALGLVVHQTHSGTKVRDSEGFSVGTIATMESLTRLDLSVMTREESGRRTWAVSPKGKDLFESMKDGRLKRPQKAKHLCRGCGCSRGLCLCPDA